jgi:hypothetical protein
MKLDGLTPKRTEEIARTHDAVLRARAAGGAGQAALDQAKDRLGTLTSGKTTL